MSNLCDCDLRNRKWNPFTGRCEFCGRRYKQTPKIVLVDKGWTSYYLHHPKGT